MRWLRRTAAFFVLSLMGVVATEAADVVLPQVQPLPPPQPSWTFLLTPYFWAAGMNGSVGVRGAPPVSVDLSFSDIIRHLKFGAAGTTEARNGRFGVLTDLNYAKLGANFAGPGPFAITATVTPKIFIGTAMAEYRIVDAPGASIDLMAGARFWDLQATLAFSGGPLGGLSFSGGKDWVDVMVGAKARYDISSQFYLTGWGMIGGFGTSARTDWDVFGAVGYNLYNLHPGFSMFAGYRVLGENYRRGGFVFDITEQGPILGSTFQF